MKLQVYNSSEQNQGKLLRGYFSHFEMEVIINLFLFLSFSFHTHNIRINRFPLTQDFTTTSLLLTQAEAQQKFLNVLGRQTNQSTKFFYSITHKLPWKNNPFSSVVRRKVK